MNLILANVVPTQLLVVEVLAPFPLFFTFSYLTSNPPEVRPNGAFSTYSFKNVPPYEPAPFALPSDASVPRLIMYYQPEGLGPLTKQGTDTYWISAAWNWFREDYERDVIKGWEFDKFTTEITVNLPAAPQAKATELLARLERKIQNVSMPTYAETALVKGRLEKIVAKELNRAVKAGQTNGSPWARRANSSP